MVAVLPIRLEDLVQRNPGITSIDLIGHSMGGLVSRSALFYGKQNMYQWIHRLKIWFAWLTTSRCGTGTLWLYHSR